MRNVIAFALSLFVAGCSNPPPPGTEKEIFPDAPSPQGFTYVAGYGHKAAAFRTYTQSYEGERRLDDTVKWYKEAWKANGWQLKSDSGGDPDVLTFINGNPGRDEKAVVTVASAAKGLKIDVKFNKKDD